jgi:hypothetical protein
MPSSLAMRDWVHPRRRRLRIIWRSKPGGFVPGFTLNVVVDRRKESVLPILLIVGVRH